MQIPADILSHNARAASYTGPKGPWYEHLCEDEGLSREDASQQLQDFEFIPFDDPVRGHMATLIKQNKEVHFAIYRKYRSKAQVSIKRIREFLQPILDKEVYLVTKLGPEDDDRFILHLGFEPMGSTMAGIRTYILNEIQYPRHKNARH